jgi:uncharacterized protein YjbI with pentapeptide repeats
MSKYFYGGQKATNHKGELFKVILQFLGGTILLLGTYQSLEIVDAMNDNNILVEKGNIADRFKNAIIMLGDNSSSTRLGGIYALNNIAKDNREYREQIFNILVEYVCDKTKELMSWEDIPKPDRFLAQPSNEINTIMNLLFSKDYSLYKNLKATIENAKFYGAQFNNYNFSRCTFKNVEFQNSEFKDTWFIECNISNTDFTFSDFKDVYFSRSKITMNTVFACSSLVSTDFTICSISETDFSCSRMVNPFFGGARVGFSSFDGVYLLGGIEGAFNASTFNRISVKELFIPGGIEARGARFETGSILGGKKIYGLRVPVGEMSKINIEKEVEKFPKEKLERFEELIDIDSRISIFRNNLINIKNGHNITTGWVFSDRGVFTSKDSLNLINHIDEIIGRLKD